MHKKELQKFLDAPMQKSVKYVEEQLDLYEAIKDLKLRITPLTECLDEAGFNTAIVTKTDGKWHIKLCNVSEEIIEDKE